MPPAWLPITIMTNLEQYFAALRSISTATITTILEKKGLKNVRIRGAMPMAGAVERMVGPAFTVRFIPGREDIAKRGIRWDQKSSRLAVENMPKGCIAVIDANGTEEAGFWGDILVMRMLRLGVAGIVSDGVIRDISGARDIGLPLWAKGVSPSPAVAGLSFVNWQEPVGCGGVAVYPDDIMVADADGAVVIPPEYVEDVVTIGLEQERFEAWVLDQVSAGASLVNLYPPNEENMARYRKETQVQAKSVAKGKEPKAKKSMGKKSVGKKAASKKSTKK